VPIGLVIFDCDGVLIDGEVMSCRARAEVFPPCYCGVDHA
jgi:beta-phosphoglucomutase-like phosphatase (HAD superfamily)